MTITIPIWLLCLIGILAIIISLIVLIDIIGVIIEIFRDDK